MLLDNQWVHRLKLLQTETFCVWTTLILMYRWPTIEHHGLSHRKAFTPEGVGRITLDTEEGNI